MNFDYFHVKEGKCAKEYGVEELHSLLIFRTFDFSPLQYEGKPEVNELKHAIKDASRPILAVFDEDIASEIFNNGHDAIVLFTDA